MKELLRIKGQRAVEPPQFTIGQPVQVQRVRDRIAAGALGRVVAIQEHPGVGPCPWVQVAFGEVRTGWELPCEFTSID